jgi:hypothetical protein
MRALLLRRTKYLDADGDLVELVLWQVTRSVEYPDGLRYRLAFVPSGARTPGVLYDNHHPKGHHRHSGRVEDAYPFTTAARLLRAFLTDVRRAKTARQAKEGTR